MKNIRAIINMLTSSKAKKRRQRALAALMAVVVFCTTYTLILPAITLDSQTAETEPGIEAEGPAEETLGEVQEADLLLEGQNAGEAGNDSVETEEAESASIPAETEAIATTQAETEAAAPAPETTADTDKSAPDTEKETVRETEKETEKETEAVYAKSPLIYHCDDYDIEISFDSEDWQLPEGTVLNVKELHKDAAKDSEEYSDYHYYDDRAKDELSDMDEALAERAYAIHFYELQLKADGEELSVPEGEADIAIKYHPVDKASYYAQKVEGEETILASLFWLSDWHTNLFDKNGDGSKIYTLKDGYLEEVRIKDQQLSDFDNVIGLLACPPEKAVTLKAEGNDYSVTAVCSQENSVPEDAKLAVSEILPSRQGKNKSSAYDEYVAKTEDALGLENGEASYARVFDIKIVDKDNPKITYQPAEDTAIDVEIELKDANKDEELGVVHFADRSASGEAVDSETQGQAVNFEADGDSVYAIVGTGSIIAPFTASDGHTYEVTVSYDQSAGIPEDAQLEVAEVTEKDKDYDKYKSATEDLVTDEQSKLEYIKLLDISIVKDGKKVVPKSPVDVSIKLMDTNAPEEDMQVVHFGKKTEVLENTAENGEVSFSTNGFSVFAVAYTVDFEYNGYSFSMPGEGTILLSEVFNQLHIKKAVADVEDVEFTDDTLLKIEKEEADWKITSLKAFDTEETMTINFENGDVIVIKVTDAPGALFTIKIGNADPVECADWTELVSKIPTTGTNAIVIEVLGDATATSTLSYGRNRAFTINGNGYTLTRGSAVTGDLITLNSTSAMSINDLKIDGGDSGSGILLNKDGTGALNCTNVTFEGACTTLANVSGGAPTFTNCKFEGNKASGTLITLSTTGNVNITGDSTADSYIRGASSETSNTLIYKNAQGPISINNTAITANGSTGKMIYRQSTYGGMTTITGCAISGSSSATIEPMIFDDQPGGLKLYSTSFERNGISGDLIVKQKASNCNGTTNLNNKIELNNLSVDNGTDLCDGGFFSLNCGTTTAYIATDSDYAADGAKGSFMDITGSATLELSGGTISGASSDTNHPVVKAGSGALILSNVSITGHQGIGGVCAVEAQSASNVMIENATTINGNTDGDGAGNLHISDTATKTKIGALTGTVGITTTKDASGDNFAQLSSAQNTSALTHIKNDSHLDYMAVKGNGTTDTNVYWISGVNPKKTSKFYITGNMSFANDVTQYFDTLEEAVAAATQFAGAVTINSMVDNYTMFDPIEIGKDITIQPGKTTDGEQLSRLTIKRGSELGTLILHKSGAFTLKEVTLDGENKGAAGPLIKVTGGAGDLTLDNTTVKNHKAVDSDVYAVDATDSLAKIKLLGAVNIHGNTSKGKSSNLGVTGVDKLTVVGNLTGTIGVSNVLHYLPGEQFGVKSNSSYSMGVINNDLLPEVEVDAQNNTNLVWKGSSTGSGAVVKLTDANGNLLYTNNSHSNPAVFNTLESMASAINAANPNIFDANGQHYSGKINCEFLQDIVKSGTGAAGVSITNTRDLVFKTASKDATDGYPFVGKGSRTKIVFMNGGNNSTDSRFIFTGNGTKVRFENIIVDGRADQGITADQGALVSVGDIGANPHIVEFTLGEGAILQNGESNWGDPGGAVYVGIGSKMYMEPGSIIQYCHANKGNDTSHKATGGAIYLAKSELYCNGGVIRNCISAYGGAVDLGGTSDGEQSDAARIYFSGSPQIIENYNNDGDPLNVHLFYDSNEIINVIGDLSAGARIGIYPDDKDGIFEKHGRECMPFATIKNGVQPANLSAFANDRDTKLSGEQSVTDPQLVVWFYEMSAFAVEDYCIDGAVIRTAEIDGSEGTIRPQVLPTEYTYKTFEETYHTKYPYILNKGAEYDRITLQEYRGNAEVNSGVTGIRYTPYLQGRRWEYQNSSGEWQPINGRDLTFHYKRENRDNLKLNKIEETDPGFNITDASFKLERSYPDSDSYTLYKQGTGKGSDTGENGIYRTDVNGLFTMNLPEGYYRLTEVSAPEGYMLLDSPITFKVSVKAVQDTEVNKRTSPYSVEQVSSNAVYETNAYETWSSEHLFGRFTVKDQRRIPLHVLYQSTPGVYQLKDNDWRLTEYTTANIDEGEKNIRTLNPNTAIPAEYELLGVYAGTVAGSNYTLDRQTDITKIQGTGNGIIINGDTSKVLERGKALYYIVGEPKQYVTITKQWADSTITVSDKSNGNMAVRFEIYGIVPAAEPGGTPTKTKLQVDGNDTFAVTAEGENNVAWSKTVYIDRYASYELVEKSITRADNSVSPDEVNNYTTSFSWDNTNTRCTVTNTRKVVDLQIRKVDGTNTATKLSGAHFTLKRKNLSDMWEAYGASEYVTSDGTAAGSVEGEFTLTLPSGEYQLTETSSPGGYVILQNNTTFTVDAGKATLNTDPDQSDWAIGLDEDGKNVADATQESSVSVDNTEKVMKTICIKNTKGSELPSTGGMGTKTYTLGGFALLAAAALMYGFRMRRRERRLK